MGKDRPVRPSQTNTMAQYTTPRLGTLRAAKQDQSGSSEVPHDGDSGMDTNRGEEPSRADIIEAIKGSREALEGQIRGVSVEVNLLRTDLRKVADKVHTAEADIAQLQTEVKTLKQQVTQLKVTTGALEYRVEDAEGRSRRNNLRLLGFPERSEGRETEAFVEKWILESLKPAGLSPQFAIERAHRALVPPPPPGAPPRAIIARVLNYRDRDAILKASREAPDARFENSGIHVYPDYTNKVQQMRKSFIEVKQKLRAMDIRYMLLYPAKLKVISQGKSHFFERPEEVWNWLDMWDAVPVQAMTSGDPFHTRQNRENRNRRRGPRGGGGSSSGRRRFLVLADGTIEATTDATREGSVLVPDTAEAGEKGESLVSEENVHSGSAVPETIIP